MLDLRSYQELGVSMIREAIRIGKKRILVVSPTGSGKGHIAAYIMQAAEAKSKHTLFVVHRREIIHQLSDKLASIAVDHGIILSGHKKSFMSTTHVASIQTLVRRDFPQADVLIIDEAHRASAASYQKIIANYPDAIVVGFTATPCRSDGRGLGNVFDTIVQFTSTQELIRDGFLVPILAYAPERPDLSGVQIKRGDYDETQLEKEMDKPKLVGSLVEHWERLAKGRKTIVFASGVAHSRHIADEFNNNGIRAEHLDGETPKHVRDGIADRLRSGEIDVISNMGCYVEGVDIPEVSCIMLARPTKHFGSYLQMAGRGLRPARGKTDLLILDHAGNVYEHGLPDQEVVWTLEKKEVAYKTKKYEPKEPKPWVCEHCFAINQPSRTGICERCGQKKVGKAESPAIGPGMLVKVDSKKKRKIDPNDKEKIWKECFWKAAKLGLKLGSAAHMFKKKVGTFPRGMPMMPSDPSHWQMLASVYYETVVKCANIQQQEVK